MLCQQLVDAVIRAAPRDDVDTDSDAGDGDQQGGGPRAVALAALGAPLEPAVASAPPVAAALLPVAAPASAFAFLAEVAASLMAASQPAAAAGGAGAAAAASAGAADVEPDGRLRDPHAPPTAADGRFRDPYTLSRQVVPLRLRDPHAPRLTARMCHGSAVQRPTMRLCPCRRQCCWRCGICGGGASCYRR